jgi:predicted dehydrogenase
MAMDQVTIGRRAFLKAGAAAGAGLAAGYGLNARSYARVAGANQRMNLAVIGVGGRGRRNLDLLAGRERSRYGPGGTYRGEEYAERVTGTHIAALCDVNMRRAGDAFEAYPEAVKYVDYRKMLDQMDGDVDAVVVSTSDHSHAPASVTAMRMGKPVFCEKPGAHSVREARVMAQVAKEQGVATQLCTQGNALDNIRRTVELIGSGAIGEVSAFHIWERTGARSIQIPTESSPEPDSLHWDLWLGPAPWRPYHPDYIPRGQGWQLMWDFAGGQLTNMGCHYFNWGFRALELQHPSTIEAQGPDPPHPQIVPPWLHVRYTFERGDGRTPVTLTWTHGDKPRAVFAEHELPDWAWGVFVGDKGMLLVDYDRHMLWPEDEFKDYQPPEPSIPPSVGHYLEWIQACRGEGEALCHFGYAMPITEAVLLGNVAYRSGRKLQWNAEQFTMENAHEAEGFLQRGYRPGWTL